MTKFSTKALLSVSILAISGCATSANTAISTQQIQSELNLLNAPANWAFGPQINAEIADNWASIIDDLELKELIQEALENNHSLKVSAENIARSQALLKQSGASRLPTLSSTLSSTGRTALDDINLGETYSAGLNASWEIDLWGQIRDNITSAEYDLEGVKSVYNSAKQSLTASVIRAYTNLVEAKNRRDLSKATLDAQLETLRIVNVRFEFGNANHREQVLAQSDVANAQDNLAVAEADVRTAVRALEVLLGRYPDATLQISDNFPKVSTSIAAGQPADLLRRRPDVLSAEYNVRAAFANESSTVSSKWPTLRINSDLASSVDNLGDILNPADLALSIGARLADTLFDGGLTNARIEAAQATSRQAVRSYGQVVLDAFADVENALDTIKLLDERYEYVLKASEASRETLRLAEIQYKAGDFELLDVLTFRQRSFQSDQALLSVKRQLIDARIALYLALGGGST
ncbi:TolC family protein [Hirschia litorea]|uniref:TolC family protein n=1 Tax=Hirschia litorea TaxID=1199156 RepID=A0ABW2IH44_9PROT